MGTRARSMSAYAKLSMPVSYKVLDEGKLYDCRNIFDNKGITETRNGIERYNTTSLSGRILSVSFFKNDSGTRYKLAKVSTVLKSVVASGAASDVKTGLTSTTKHRGVTLNNRHILAIETDGLFSYNGTTFTQLGQAAPSTLTAAVSNGGSLSDATQFQAAITFYASSIGLESNAFSSSIVTTSSPNLQVALTNIPATASNALIDKVRIYLKDVTANGSFLFIAEINIGTTTYTITSESTSTQTPPTKHGAPPAGGGKFITKFGSAIAYTGNSTFKSDVFISEDGIPDAFDDTTTARTLNIPGQGECTGIAEGLYDNSYLNPFLVIFKKTSTTIYSELGGNRTQVTIDDHIGCVSHDTIKVREGVVYFMSENGFYSIKNGRLSDKSLGEGDIDDIFSREGWAYQLNASQYPNFFSAYYSTLNQYLTFVSEGANNSLVKAYNYEERIKGFRVYEFKTPLTCACEGEDDSGNQCLFFGDTTGTLFTFSVKNDRHDDDETGASETIPAFIYTPFTMPGDDHITYNFKQLAVKAIDSSNMVTVKAFPGYSLVTNETVLFDFSNDTPGFILDLSQLDVDVLGDERVPTKYVARIDKTGESMIIGFFQDIIDANMGLISSQLTFNRNGNHNL